MLTMYSTTWCGDCHRLKSQLDREAIPYVSVDIEQDPTAEAYVLSVNGGRQLIPTLLFEDGSVLVEPTIVEVREHLAGLARPAAE